MIPAVASRHGRQRPGLFQGKREASGAVNTAWRRTPFGGSFDGYLTWSGIDWIESKLDEHGVKKILPDQETLELAYRPVRHKAEFEKQVQEAREELEREWEAKLAEYTTDDDKIKVPKSLPQKVRKVLERNRQLFWESAILLLAGASADKRDEEATDSDEAET
jgi:hypothetical protein